ncbi:MAG TPA: hypothetical protein VIW01_00540 [Dehalococcoidia bacterium]
MKALIPVTVLAAAILFAACGDDDDGGATDAPTGTAPGVTATEAPTGSPGQSGECAGNVAELAAAGPITWDVILPADVPAPEGWSVGDAEGDAPFLEVGKDGEAVGSLELLQFEVPFDAAGGYDELDAWVNAEFYPGVVADRAAVGLTAELDATTPVAFGGFCGIAYSFSVTDSNGALTERFSARATFDSENLYLVTATYDAAVAGEGIGFQTAEVLIEYEPGLTRLVEALDLPVE